MLSGSKSWYNKWPQRATTMIGVIGIYIERNISKNKVYLRLCDKVKPEDGGKPQKRVILNLGAEDELTDGKPDFLERLRQSFSDGHPIIPELLPYIKTDTEIGKVVLLPFPVSGNNPDGAFCGKLFADLLLNAYIDELGLRQLFTRIKSDRKIEYDLLGFARLLIYGRILNPQSKWSTVRQNESYYRPLLEKNFNPYNIYDTLDVFHEYRVNIFQTINKALQGRSSGRDTSVIFYDVTNFFFEIEQNDLDVMDDQGVTVEEGLRKRGHCKEERTQPIVQMGLFMDKEGVPIGVKSFPGNTADQSTLIPATSEILGPLNLQRFIYCADRGLCNLENLAFLVKDGQGYLLSKSIKKSKKEDRNWIVDPTGYTEQKGDDGVVTFKYKSRIVERDYFDDDGNTTTFEEKVVAFWSLEYYKREQHQMESFTKFLLRLETETKNFTLSASQIKQIQRFLKDEVLEGIDPKNDLSPITETSEDTAMVITSEDKPGESTSEKKPKRRRLSPEEKAQREADKKAEAARIKSLKASRKKQLNEQLKDSVTTKTMIDWDKVNQWREFAGYYQIVTSELEMEDLTVISTYRGLTQIENRFRTMKGPLQTRPIFLSTPEHIDGHLVSCGIALTIDTLIQTKVKKYLGENELKDKKWGLGLSGERIQDALNALQVEAMPQNYMRLRSREEDQTGQDLQTILAAHRINLDSRLYAPGELRALRSSFNAL